MLKGAVNFDFFQAIEIEWPWLLFVCFVKSLLGLKEGHSLAVQIGPTFLGFFFFFFLQMDVSFLRKSHPLPEKDSCYPKLSKDSALQTQKSINFDMFLVI